MCITAVTLANCLFPLCKPKSLPHVTLGTTHFHKTTLLLPGMHHFAWRRRSGKRQSRRLSQTATEWLRGAAATDLPEDTRCVLRQDDSMSELASANLASTAGRSRMLFTSVLKEEGNHIAIQEGRIRDLALPTC